ncbi:MAG: hypothetical protein GDA51_13795 [Ekhidna sp.]|nr:hypothetical protein [Ekhidna sp.]MBC6427502.1 hypothetical protein [Ekhidna sp.]
MSDQQRTKFRSSQDWNDFILSNPQLTGADLKVLRNACYKEIESFRKKPLLVYATKFIETDIPTIPNTIDLADVEGFTDLANSIDSGDAVDILLHSPGGRPDATERIVSILRNRFKQIDFLVPHSAYSAATMLALSGDSITLHPSATLGPIDPQLNGTPARSIKRGFDKVKDIIKNEGPESLPAYIPLIEKYTLDLLELCEDSEKLSKELVTDWLKQYMFKGKTNDKITEIVDYFSDYDSHLLHSRPLLLSKIQHFKMPIKHAEGDLKDLLWEAYILLNGFFSGTPFIKLYENSTNLSWGKQTQVSII